MRHTLAHTETSEFIKGGKATITLQSNITGRHFTYKIAAPKGQKDQENFTGPYFVSILNGPHNHSNFQYVGYINRAGNFIHGGSKARAGADSQSVLAFKWFIDNLGKKSNALTVFHEGKCCRCGRKLTTPESLISGIGPHCAGLSA